MSNVAVVIATNFTLYPRTPKRCTPDAFSSASSGCAPNAMILSGRGVAGCSMSSVSSEAQNLTMKSAF